MRSGLSDSSISAPHMPRFSMLSTFRSQTRSGGCLFFIHMGPERWTEQYAAKKKRKQKRRKKRKKEKKRKINLTTQIQRLVIFLIDFFEFFFLSNWDPQRTGSTRSLAETTLSLLTPSWAYIKSTGHHQHLTLGPGSRNGSDISWEG